MKYTVTTPTGTRTVEVYWPSGVKRLGLNVSGGFDSALMLWLWANFPTPEGCELLAVTTDRGLGAKEFASRIVDHVNSLTGRSIQHLVLPVAPTTPHSKQVSNPVTIAMRRGMYDCMMGADTGNPPVTLPGVEPVRLSLEKQNYANAKHPFLHCDKTHTVQLVQELGLSWIPEMSHTCTETSDVRCGRCWQCSERAWAYQTLGLTDIGRF